MKYYLLLIFILVAGAAMLSPMIAYLGLDPLPGDIAINRGDVHFSIPVAYSLCASMGLGLFYYLMKR